MNMWCLISPLIKAVLHVHSCKSEMEQWVEDIRMAIDLAEQSSVPDAGLLSTSPADNSETFFWVSLQFFYSKRLQLPQIPVLHFNQTESSFEYSL